MSSRLDGPIGPGSATDRVNILTQMNAFNQNIVYLSCRHYQAPLHHLAQSRHVRIETAVALVVRSPPPLAGAFRRSIPWRIPTVVVPYLDSFLITGLIVPPLVVSDLDSHLNFRPCYAAARRFALPPRSEVRL